MGDCVIRQVDEIKDSTLSELKSKNVGLVIGDLDYSDVAYEELVQFIKLPWRYVVIESTDGQLFKMLSSPLNYTEKITRVSGIISNITEDPSKVNRPQNTLPVYWLEGDSSLVSEKNRKKQLREMTMIDDVLEEDITEIVSLGGSKVPKIINVMWNEDGNIPQMLFAWQNKEKGDEDIKKLEPKDTSLPTIISCIENGLDDFIKEVNSKFGKLYDEKKQIINIKHGKELLSVDISELEDPQNPVKLGFELLLKKDLFDLAPERLSEEEIERFFYDPCSSWRPYAAKLPWISKNIWFESVEKRLRKLERQGGEFSQVGYISSQSGAGGTTMLRMLAWKAARLGYPTLVAKSIPFDPDPESLTSFFQRVQKKMVESSRGGGNTRELYKVTPWVLVFDTPHWENRTFELTKFCKKIVEGGSAVYVMILMDERCENEVRKNKFYKKIGILNHSKTEDEVRDLGRHLNKYLKLYGKDKSQTEWSNFYINHTTKYLKDMAMFWVALSFWVQGQVDLGESLQQRLYKRFDDKVDDQDLARCVLKIAAMSILKRPVPASLLGGESGRFPISSRLTDLAEDIPGLGLICTGSGREEYWSIMHDVIGRFLIEAYRNSAKGQDKYGIDVGNDLEHCVFLLLREIAENKKLLETQYKQIAEEISVSILKIDPDHGKNNFTIYWREVLSCLDRLKKRGNGISPLFLHHLSISRRRISRLDPPELYKITLQDKKNLLRVAVDDLEFALGSFPMERNGESELNLYNSLARACSDLEHVEVLLGSDPMVVKKIKEKANDATKKAYQKNPENSFAVETYVENLLRTSEEKQEGRVENCIKALDVIYPLISSENAEYRKRDLNKLFERTIKLLFGTGGGSQGFIEAKNSIDVLMNVWSLILNKSSQGICDLRKVPIETRKDILEYLDKEEHAHYGPILHLKYDLLCITNANLYKKQLTCLEEYIYGCPSIVSMQKKLEYAILLYQDGRYQDGSSKFQEIRKILDKKDFFVTVPRHLKWLRDCKTGKRKSVTVCWNGDSDFGKPKGAVKQFRKQKVPFRDVEFPFLSFNKAQVFQALVSFGRKGPFLRPLTATEGK